MKSTLTVAQLRKALNAMVRANPAVNDMKLAFTDLDNICWDVCNLPTLTDSCTPDIPVFVELGGCN